MEITFTIHNNFEHCSIYFKDEKYSYNRLKETIKKRGNDYIKKKKVKSKPYSNLINENSEGFEKSNLSIDEQKEFEYLKQKSKAKSWLSSQRTLRKKGKLKQNQIDKLNQLGMLWNPKVDEWEINYDKYRKEILVDVLLKMKFKEYGLSDSKLNDLKNQEVWIKQQRELFYKGKLEEENLKRLKAIDFPFEPTLDENHKITLYQLVRLVYKTKTLKEELVGSRKLFVNFYELPLENKNIGSKIDIAEEIVDKKREERKQLELQRELNRTAKFDAHREKVRNDIIEILKTKPADYFIKQIDKTYNKTVSAYSIAFDRYFDIYSELNTYLFNTFLFPRTKIDNKVYEETYVKYEFNDDIKRNVSEKMLSILDEKLLSTGRLNKKKSFKPISFLVKYYKKKNLVNELLILDKIIQRHQILSIIYSERIKKVWKSLN